MSVLRPFSGRRDQSRYTLALLSLSVFAVPGRSDAQTKTYVAHGTADLVTAIDTATGTVAGTLAVGDNPSRVAISRDGTRAYVSNTGSDSISVIDTAAGQVTATVPVGDGPSALAVTPDGGRLYVVMTAGVVQVVDTASYAVIAVIPVGLVGPLGTSGDIAITPDGARAFVAAGLVYVIDTATNAVAHSFVAEAAPVPNQYNSASSVAISPDGTRAYVGVTTWNLASGGFSGSVVLVDTASESVTGNVFLNAMPGAIALTPDGSRAYVVVQAFWADTGYGAAPFPGRVLDVIDTSVDAVVGLIDLGADGPGWSVQNTAAGIGVTPDRRAVYAAIPRLGAVAVADVNTNTVTSLIPVTAGPGALAIVPDDDAVLVPYKVDAVADAATATTTGGTPIANVLANDRFGGLQADLAHVTLTQVSSSSKRVKVVPGTGAVLVAAGTPVGTYKLVYRICEIADASNCDKAAVTLTIRAPSVVDAVNDSATTLPGRRALVSVLANDTIDGLPAAGKVTLSSVSSTSSTIQLDVSTGAVYVWVGTVPGPHTLRYRICDITSPPDCDTADVALTVNAFPIDAVDDVVAAPRSGGTSLGNLLANDTFDGAVATLAKVRLSQVGSSPAGITLNVGSGTVSVAAGTPVGTYPLQYRICEIASPANCDEATVTVTVEPLFIYAAFDSGRGSSKLPNTVVASVLRNDRLGNGPATIANVSLAFVSLTPANNKVQLDLTDGSVDVLGKTSSGLFTMVYRICERAMPTNCAQGTVSIDLSGGQ